MADQGLALYDVSFAYARTPVLRQVSVTFAPGRLTAICGPNGSGKSTLLHAAAAQLRPSDGVVLLGDAEIAAMPAKMRALCLAMLPQSPDAPLDLTVRDLVALGRYAHRSPLAGLSQVDHRALDDALAATDMTDLAGRSLAALSGGQRQRAWIAMTLAQEAPWLLLDEPTNHLDISHANEALLLLQRLVKDEGKSVVVVLHDINLMARFADDVVLMQDGDVMADGAFEDVVTEARMSALYGRPCRFGHVDGRARPFLCVD